MHGQQNIKTVVRFDF